MVGVSAPPGVLSRCALCLSAPSCSFAALPHPASCPDSLHPAVVTLPSRNGSTLWPSAFPGLVFTDVMAPPSETGVVPISQEGKLRLTLRVELGGGDEGVPVWTERLHLNADVH